MLFDTWIKNWRSALVENFFLRGAVLLLSAALILNATVFRGSTKIVVVPPNVTTEFWVEKNKASAEYLEQMSVFLAILAGNLSPRNAKFNIDVLLKYIDSSRMFEVQDDLVAQANYIKKNNITQVFFPETTKVDVNKQTASVEGTVTRQIGAIKVSEEKMWINISYKLKDYTMRIVDISVAYPDRKEQQQKKDKEAIMPESVAGADSKDTKQRTGAVTAIQPILQQETAPAVEAAPKQTTLVKPAPGKIKK